MVPIRAARRTEAPIGSAAAHQAMRQASLFTDEESKELSEVYGEILAELKVSPEDLGKVIGKQGRTARSIRTVLAAAAAKRDKSVVLEILE